MFKLGTTAQLSGQLTQSSLGESANLDDVYDSTTDHFTGQFVITGSTQPLTVTGTIVNNICNKELQCCSPSSFSGTKYWGFTNTCIVNH